MNKCDPTKLDSLQGADRIDGGYTYASFAREEQKNEKKIDEER